MVNDAQNKISQINDLNENYKQQITELSGKEPITKVVEKVIEKNLTDSQVLVDFSPLEKAIIDLVCRNESARTRKTITPQMILKDIFNNYVTNGASDFFPLPSSSDMRNIQAAFKH